MSKYRDRITEVEKTIADLPVPKTLSEAIQVLELRYELGIDPPEFKLLKSRIGYVNQVARIKSPEELFSVVSDEEAKMAYLGGLWNPLFYDGSHPFEEVFPQTSATRAAIQNYPMNEEAQLVIAEHGFFAMDLLHNPTRLSVAVQQVLARSSEETTRNYIAYFYELDDKVAEELAQDENAGVRIAVARHPGLRESTLAALSREDDDDVRGSVAGQKNLPESIRHRMINDSSYYVRMVLANRDDLTQEEYKILALDSEDLVRNTIGRNPKVSEVLRTLASL